MVTRSVYLILFGSWKIYELKQTGSQFKVGRVN